MKNKMIVSPSPFVAQRGNSTRRIMLDVIIAMVPMIICAVVFFGAISIALILVTTLAAVAAELAYNVLYALAKRKKVNRELLLNGSHTDLSAVITGVLIALNLPAAFPIWAAVLGAVVAIVLVKMVFGGIGKNFANPALVARIFLFMSFGTAFATYSANNMIDGTVAGTWLGTRSADIAFWFSGERLSGYSYLLDMMFGLKNTAAIGEVSAIAILLGFVYLLVRKVIDFKVPVYIMGATFLFALLFDGLPRLGNDVDAVNALIYVPLAHVFTGGLLLGAVFMATDYASSPNTELGNLIYSIGIALLTVLIRLFGNLPEGVSFAIVIMNVVTPLLDKYLVPKPFGRREREAIEKAKKEAEKANSEVKA